MATGKAPPNDSESAILHTFAPGKYTGIVRGQNNTAGVALFEAYDLDQSFLLPWPTSALAVLSTSIKT